MNNWLLYLLWSVLLLACNHYTKEDFRSGSDVKLRLYSTGKYFYALPSSKYGKRNYMYGEYYYQGDSLILVNGKQKSNLIMKIARTNDSTVPAGYVRVRFYDNQFTPLRTSSFCVTLNSKSKYVWSQDNINADVPGSVLFDHQKWYRLSFEDSISGFQSETFEFNDSANSINIHLNVDEDLISYLTWYIWSDTTIYKKSSCGFNRIMTDVNHFPNYLLGDSISPSESLGSFEEMYIDKKEIRLKLKRRNVEALICAKEKECGRHNSAGFTTRRFGMKIRTVTRKSQVEKL